MNEVKRIVIIGTSGCGKSYLGAKIAQLLNVKFVDLDDLYWLPGWKKRPEEDFLACVKKELFAFKSIYGHERT